MLPTTHGCLTRDSLAPSTVGIHDDSLDETRRLMGLAGARQSGVARGDFFAMVVPTELCRLGTPSQSDSGFVSSCPWPTTTVRFTTEQQTAGANFGAR